MTDWLIVAGAVLVLAAIIGVLGFLYLRGLGDDWDDDDYDDGPEPGPYLAVVRADDPVWDEFGEEPDENWVEDLPAETELVPWSVDVPVSPEYLAAPTWEQAAHRAIHPHLYTDHWLRDSLEAFLGWAQDEWDKRAAWLEEMGVAA